MKSINVTDKQKDEFRRKRQILADAMGVDFNDISDTDVLHWLCENIPASKGEQLKIASDKFKEKVTIIAGPHHDHKALCVLLDDFKYILQKIVENPERLQAYCEAQKKSIDTVNAKFPPNPFPIKKRIDNGTDDRGTVDKQG